MNLSEISAELRRLLADAKRRGVTSSVESEIYALLDMLERSPLTVKQAETKLARTSKSKTQGGGQKPARAKRDAGTVAQTIEQLVAKLNASFNNDTTFEQTVIEAEGSQLTKDNVVALYNRLFRTDKKFPKATTKPDLFNAIRRERIARVRYRS